MSSLMCLDLFDNFIPGTIPDEIGKLKSLTIFSVMLNQTSGSVPEIICDLPNLITLEI